MLARCCCSRNPRAAGRFGHPAANLVNSNVPGAKEPRYLNGTRLRRHLPDFRARGLDRAERHALATSYQDHMDFGFIANAGPLYDLSQLARHTLVAYEEREVSSRWVRGQRA